MWTQAQKRRFVEGIFLGLGSGYYVTNGLEWADDGATAPMAGWLLDGQQRMNALRVRVVGRDEMIDALHKLLDAGERAATDCLVGNQREEAFAWFSQEL